MSWIIDTMRNHPLFVCVRQKLITVYGFTSLFSYLLKQENNILFVLTPSSVVCAWDLKQLNGKSSFALAHLRLTSFFRTTTNVITVDVPKSRQLGRIMQKENWSDRMKELRVMRWAKAQEYGLGICVLLVENERPDGWMASGGEWR